MTREELLLSRGFRTEKELETFLENCEDESWKKELIEFYGEKPKKSDKKSSEKKKVKETEVTEEVTEEVIDETPVEEVVEETTEEIVTNEIVTE